MANSGSNSPSRNPESPPRSGSDENVTPAMAVSNNNPTPSREGGGGGAVGSYTLQRNVPGMETNLRKRAREGGDPGAGPSTLPPQLRPAPPVLSVDVAPEVPVLATEDGEAVELVCAVCVIRFESDKSLARHMRMHPERPWRAMFPPPRDEFADVRELLNDPEEEEEEEEEEAERKPNLPDLNKSP
ncbi:uncharacterized protein LOC124925104 [Impatiens glandulifera]|uniref:uncharacterized protein LOC124925104 n=1 Tax=Impatiens glandulifera TaxID=253017 RepID=UPI001FB0ECB0|nr:uncharacterized protein LOC124925104 [Impatiens glandulifera]